MKTSLSRTDECKVFTLYPTYENVHALLADIHLYVFGQDGSLSDNQAISRGRATIAVAEDKFPYVRIVIAPQQKRALDAPATLEDARECHVFETELKLEPDQLSYQLPPVPESVWRWWLVHNLWINVREISRKKTGFLLW